MSKEYRLRGVLAQRAEAHLRDCLIGCRGNVSEVARLMEVHRNTVINMMRRYKVPIGFGKGE